MVRLHLPPAPQRERIHFRVKAKPSAAAQLFCSVAAGGLLADSRDARDRVRPAVRRECRCRHHGVSIRASNPSETGADHDPPPPQPSSQSPQATFILYESASGYALFEGLDMDEIGQTSEAVQQTVT